MRSKLWLYFAAAWMVLTGLFRGAGGLMLMLKGSNLPTPIPITAAAGFILLGGLTLLLVSLFLILSALLLWRKLSPSAWSYCRWALIIFLSGGLLNGYLLYGSPQTPGQMINFIAAVVPFLCLHLGRPALQEP